VRSLGHELPGDEDTHAPYENEQLEARLLLGGALVVVANVLLSLSSRSRTTAA